MEEKLELKDKIKAVDLNVRELWDSINEDEQKKLKGEYFILNRYISNVKTSNRESQEHFVLTVNEYFNKNFYNLQKHPKLLWTLLCMCNNDQKTYYHEWIGRGKGAGADTKKQKLLRTLYPDMRNDDLEVLDAITPLKEAKALAVQHGLSDDEIKKIL